jgi:hypothetical protein
VKRPIGHFFDGWKVEPVYTDLLGQYILIDQDDGGEPQRLNGRFLNEGQDWLSRGVSGQFNENQRLVMMRRAVHESGHAVICLEEGIAVEYITIAPKQGQLGYCQYEYGLTDKLKANISAWGEKFVRITLGGMEAEKLFLDKVGSSSEPEHPMAWSKDQWVSRECINEMIGLGLTYTVDVDIELSRLQSSVRERLQLSEVWSIVETIAERLLEELAISGTMAKKIFLAGRSGH